MDIKTPQTTILLIEDDEEDYILLKKHLTRIAGMRYTVLWETSYETGLERMMADRHDLCMVDYRLGTHNGIELLRAARAHGYNQPIVMLTGASGPEIDIQALQAGADDYIDKSHLQGELLNRVIRYAIERRKAEHERKKAEHEREELLREQMATKELEKRKNEFISIVVHELKTPLTSLKGYTQLLGRQLKGNEQASRFTKRLDTQINRLTELIDDLRDVTRIESGTFSFRESNFDFDELVEEIIESIQLITGTHIIRCEGASHITLYADRERTGQVLTNFLTNAIKYAPDTKEVLVTISADEHNVKLSVHDEGPGIPKNKQEKIFDPFYRLDHKSTAPGLGLGLYIAASIIQQQQGQIWVESEEGQGTTFSFTLPIKQAPAEEIQEPDFASSKKSHQTR